MKLFYCCECRLPSLIICVFCGPLCCCHAGDHPCRDYQLEIDLTARRHQDERIVPDLMDLQQVHCSWLLKVPHLTEKKFLVLEGMSNKPELNSSLESLLQYELYDPTVCAGLSFRRNVTKGLFCVLPLIDRKTAISVSQNRRTNESHDAKPIYLRAVTPLAGFCSRDMLSFRGNCYYINPARETLNAVMHNTIGEARLASFSRMTELSLFVAANNNRLNIYPRQRPLNLKQRIRIGIFHNKISGYTYGLKRNDSGCGMKIFSGPTDILPRPDDGNCGYLELNEIGQAEIKFGDCYERLPSLVTFPESVTVRCRHCGFNHEQHVSEILAALFADGVASTAPAGADSLNEEVVLAPIIAGICAAVIVSLAVLGAIAVWSILWRTKSSLDIASADKASCQLQITDSGQSPSKPLLSSDSKCLDENPLQSGQKLV